MALRVDAERLRREFFPAFIASHFNHVDGPTGFPPLTVTVVDAGGRVVYPYGGPPPTRYVDERTFALVFFDPELQRFIAPEGHKPEMWRLRTGYDNQSRSMLQTPQRYPRAGSQSYTFSSNDKGVHTFSWSFNALGRQSITVQDTGNTSLLGSLVVNVVAK